ncbi:hypothetical protein BN946_scf184600.g14 [Trametes cinnabarina]|uniref:DUF6535 domain-containing protein n=1 Tax=Pycnoporus cinnabarinus TaxID=5643 RepID=A0A060SQ14_PYCCI|nr:hypothetical protein BN946_scf184600.g14 [Trametes cinnabarina]
MKDPSTDFSLQSQASKRTHTPHIPMPPKSRRNAEKEDWGGWGREDIVKELESETTEADYFKAQDALEKAIKSPLEDTLDRYHKELEALLLYAGLFSAVLTAFNVESYRLLQPDAAESNSSAIKQLSAELRNLVSHSRFEPAPIPLHLREETGATLAPPTFVIWVNCLWFASLIVSLSAATIALLVKQWLYECRTGFSDQTPASIELLQYRMKLLCSYFRGVDSWYLLVGTSTLLWRSSRTVFISVLTLFIVAGTILPTLYADCCYRSPQAHLTYAVVRLLFKYASAKYERPWRQREQALLSQASELDIRMAATAWSATLNSVYLDHIRIVFCREPDAPLADFLRRLSQPTSRGDTLPVSLTRRRNVRRRLTRMVLLALRQLLALRREDRRRSWEEDVQWLIMLYKSITTSHLEPKPHDEDTLRTMFWVLMHVSSHDNLRAALDYLSSAVDIDTTDHDEPYNFARVSRSEHQSFSVLSIQYRSSSTLTAVFAATEQWITHRREEHDNIPRPGYDSPEIVIAAFEIILHCTLREIEGEKSKGTVQVATSSQQPTSLYKRTHDILATFPDHLPTEESLQQNPQDHSIWEELSSGLERVEVLLRRVALTNQDIIPANTTAKLGLLLAKAKEMQQVSTQEEVQESGSWSFFRPDLLLYGRDRRQQGRSAVPGDIEAATLQATIASPEPKTASSVEIKESRASSRVPAPVSIPPHLPKPDNDHAPREVFVGDTKDWGAMRAKLLGISRDVLTLSS